MDDFIHVHAAGTFAQHGITGMQTVFQIRDGFRIRGEPHAVLTIFKALDDMLCERADANKDIGAVFRRKRTGFIVAALCVIAEQGRCARCARRQRGRTFLRVYRRAHR